MTIYLVSQIKQPLGLYEFNSIVINTGCGNPERTPETIAKDYPGKYIYETDGKNKIIADATPYGGHKEYEITSSFVRTDDLAPYDIGEHYERGKEFTKTDERLEKIVGVLMEIMALDTQIEQISDKQSGRYDPIYDTRDYVAKHREVRCRLMNVLSELFDL